MLARNERGDNHTLNLHPGHALKNGLLAYPIVPLDAKKISILTKKWSLEREITPRWLTAKDISRQADPSAASPPQGFDQPLS